LKLSLAICSWCLKLNDPGYLKSEIDRYGINGVHYGIAHIVDLHGDEQARTIEQVRASGVNITAAMISGFSGEDYTSLKRYHETGGLIPDAPYSQRRARILDAARIARRLGADILTTHVGFLPDPRESNRFARMVDRFRELADALATYDMTLGFETGQETAETLATLLERLNRPNIGVNFDPANMILYGMGDPVDAIRRLAPFLKHLHAKDARKTIPADSESWHGEEVALGNGDACIETIISEAWKHGYRGAVAIEREMGPDRDKDIRQAVSLLNKIFRHSTAVLPGVCGMTK